MDHLRDELNPGSTSGRELPAFDVRPPNAGDAEAYVDYLQRNWSRFRGAMSTASEATFEAQTYRRRFADMMEVSEEPATVSMLMIEQNPSRRVVGDITFSNIVYGPFRACYLGFKIDRDLEGAGLMRRSLEECCEMMFARFGLHRIMANYRPENVRSGALLKRLGFQVEGFARDYLHLDGEWRDHILTSLVRPS